MRRLVLVGFLISVFATGSAHAQEKKPSPEREQILKAVSKEMAGAGIELKALEIRARIYEPQVIYVLDRARVDIDVKDEAVIFGVRTKDPLLDNHL